MNSQIVKESILTYAVAMEEYWGRWFFPLKNQFKTHTGVDISSTLIESFKNEISKLESSSKIDIIQQDVLDYEADEKRFALITACWCLGFFNDE